MLGFTEFGFLQRTSRSDRSNSPLSPVPFQSLLDESLICPWLPKMTLPWKQLLLLSVIDCLTGKPPFYISNDSFTFGHLQLGDGSRGAGNDVRVRTDVIGDVLKNTAQCRLPFTTKTQHY